jgi:hypothetical protein
MSDEPDTKPEYHKTWSFQPGLGVHITNRAYQDLVEEKVRREPTDEGRYGPGTFIVISAACVLAIVLLVLAVLLDWV